MNSFASAKVLLFFELHKYFVIFFNYFCNVIQYFYLHKKGVKLYIIYIIYNIVNVRKNPVIFRSVSTVT